jgi:hypothetical protein
MIIKRKTDKIYLMIDEATPLDRDVINKKRRLKRKEI